MTEATSAAGKHRAARRPVTPLNDLVSSISDHTQGIGRRTAAVAVSSGLLVAGGAPMAFAADTSHQATAKTAADTFQSQSARSILNAQSIVSVPDNASWSSGTPTSTAVQVSDVTKVPTPTVTAPKTSSSSGSSSSDNSQSSDPSSDISQNDSTFNPSGNAVLAVAEQYIGVPYLYGGTTPAGFDCSGFTQYVYAQLGYSIPRTAEEQLYAGTQVPASQAQPGDLIVTPGHVAIYAGGNMMIDSAKPGTTIQYRPMWQTNPTFVRIIN